MGILSLAGNGWYTAALSINFLRTQLRCVNRKFYRVNGQLRFNEVLNIALGRRHPSHGPSQSCAILHGTLNLSIVRGLVLPMCCGWPHHSKAMFLPVTVSHVERSSPWLLRVSLPAPAARGALQILDNAADLCFEAVVAAYPPRTQLAIWQTQALRYGMLRRKAPHVKRVTNQALDHPFATWSENGCEGFSGNYEFK